MPHRPEILAPAGDVTSLRAALAAGADAVYFGLDEGFNARARAESFDRESLPAVVAEVHRAGARAYLTLNTLVFQPELATLEAILRDVAAAGVDALIVQDPAVALLARAVCPSMELHASTQMTISSPEGGRFAAGLGFTRVVVPRELSVDEIRRFAAGSDLEIEVFVHGALCMSWSGQCLTSEAWGGRSANRGQCAQSCRMPYDLVVDGEARDLGEVKYLLSPKDLAALEVLPELAAIGVQSLKIEGRYKGPAYVVGTVEAYRRKLAGEAVDVGRLALTYSRGFSEGFLRGSDHQRLVEGRFPKHRGVFLGRVRRVEGDAVTVALGEEAQPSTGGIATAGAQDAPGRAAPAVVVRPGMGVVFDAGRPEQAEQGGPVFAVEARGGEVVLRFGRPGPDLRRVTVGERVWVSGDPSLGREAERRLEHAPEGRIPVTLRVFGGAGSPLVAEASTPRHSAMAASDQALAPASGGGLDATLLAEKLGAFGGTPFRLVGLDTAGLAPGLHLPVSALKALRRALAAALTAAVSAPPARAIAAGPVLPGLLADARAACGTPLDMPPTIVPLCRTDEQLEAAIAAGLPEVELDWMELVGLRKAVERARQAGLRVVIATVRVQKPGEEGYDRRIAQLQPDGVLVRHWGALIHFLEHPEERRPVLHGDFSLNVTNSLTAAHLLQRGLATFTAAHDLDRRQVEALLAEVPAGRGAVTIHHHIPTFHTEHCVYAHLLSRGRDFRSCGRPCEQHQVGLRDHTGRVHPVVVDVGCRNTVFNASAQSAAGLVHRLVELGARRLRVEFVRETRALAEDVLGAYVDLLAGRATPAELRRRVGVHEQFGVTSGTMQVLG